MIANNKNKKFHADEVVLILFICSTEMDGYSNQDLVNFAEDIEGRVDVLFEPDYLMGLKDYIKITPTVILLLKTLRERLMGLYSPRWFLKMKDKMTWGDINSIAQSIVHQLNLEWVEPNEFKDTPGVLELE